MPPSISILIRQVKLCECYDWVLERIVAKRSAFEVAILDIDVIVELGVVLIGNHREEKYILVVNRCVSNFEPEFDSVGT